MYTNRSFENNVTNFRLIEYFFYFYFFVSVQSWFTLSSCKSWWRWTEPKRSSFGNVDLWRRFCSQPNCCWYSGWLDSRRYNLHSDVFIVLHVTHFYRHYILLFILFVRFGCISFRHLHRWVRKSKYNYSIFVWRNSAILSLTRRFFLFTMFRPLYPCVFFRCSHYLFE